MAGGVYVFLYILGFIMLCALLHDGTVSLWFLWAIGTFLVAMQGKPGRWHRSNLSALTQYPLAPPPPPPPPSILQSLLFPKLLCPVCYKCVLYLRVTTYLFLPSSVLVICTWILVTGCLGFGWTLLGVVPFALVYIPT